MCNNSNSANKTQVRFAKNIQIISSHNTNLLCDREFPAPVFIPISPKRSRKAWVVAAAFASTALAIPAGPVFGQVPALASAPVAQNTGSQPNDVEEIVVTANKRIQPLQDVPITVAVLGADQIAKRHIETLADLAQAVPGLSFSPSENNTPVFTLRGIGFNEASLSAYPTVSVYVDEAPLPFPVLESQGAFDLQRVEVLKGPQGTLFGQNSTGGAINYIDAKPTQDLIAGIDVGVSRFNTDEINGFVSGPVTDTLRIRVAGHYVHSDDWQYDYTRSDSLGQTDVAAGRVIFDWRPSDRLGFTLNLNGWADNSDPQAGQLVAVNAQIPGPAAIPLLNYPFPPNNARAADWTPNGIVTPIGQTIDFRPRSRRTLEQAFLRTDYDLTDAIELTSLTSFVHFDQRQVTDYDGIALNDTDLSENNGNIRTFFQEIRLANGNDSDFRWTVGANYQDSHVHEDDAIRYQNDTQVIPSLDNIIGNGFYSTTSRQDVATFVNGEYDLTQQLTVQAGARYTDNRTHQTTCNHDLGDGRVNALFTTLGTTLSGTTIPPLTEAQCFMLNSAFIPGTPYQGSLNEQNVSWRVGVQYKFTPEVMAYANVSRGYKAGSFPTISASTYAQVGPVKEESVTAYEIGLKSDLFDRRLTLDAATFYYDYKDKQIRGKELDPIFGVLNTLINVPKSRVYGAEMELVGRPTEALTISAALTYLNSAVLNYTGTNVIGLSENFAGDRLPFTPAWQGTVDAEYRFKGMWSAEPFIGGSLIGRSGTESYILSSNFSLPASPLVRLAPGVSDPFAIRSYVTVDLRVGVTSPDDRWRVAIYGKNVFNTYYWTNAISGFDTIYREAAPPATYGVTASYKF